ncbi:HEAT repeat domain-containing protein [Rubinisphaera italica]|uniref:HEAT repeat domain-containing protein n=1 Tax=Rubinisphaera italica TaxID=2527969 RepID=UPI0011B38B95|nr:HEAT repeat domain-containing protein [Rubinisphaera italica]
MNATDSVDQISESPLVPAVVPDSSVLEGRWRYENAWPEPFEGPGAILELAQVPQFRWHFERPETVQNERAHNPATTNETEDLPTVYSRIEKPTRQQLAEWWTLSAFDDASGRNACILLAYHAPDKLDASRLDRLARITRDEINLNPQDLNTAEFVSVEPETFWNRFWSARNNPANEEQLPEETVEKTASLESEKPVEKISIQQRAAAAEAWCYVVYNQNEVAEKKYREPGQTLQDEDLPDLVRQELMIGIAREIPPRKIPGLSESLTRNSNPATQQLMQIAVMDACLVYAIHHREQITQNWDVTSKPITMEVAASDPAGLWPVTLWEQRWDDSPEMVIRFGQWLSLIRHPLAESYLTQKLSHVDIKVKQASLCSLGLLPEKSANTFLTSRLEQEQGQNKALVLLALSYQNPEIMERSVHDEDRSVRLEVAKFAGEHPSRTSLTTLLKLVKERDPEIQQAAVEAVKNWDKELAFPVLAAGFHLGMFQTRQQARESLEQHFHIVIAGIEDSQEQRRQILDQIQSEHLPEISWNETPVFHADASRLQPEEDVYAQQTRVRSQLNQLLDEELSRIEKQEIEQDLQRTAERSPVVLNRELDRLATKELKPLAIKLSKLPCRGCEPFENLDSDQLLQRRRAARQFVEIATQETLPEWTIRLLGEQLKNEQDPHVCRAILASISNDTTPQSRHVAEIALLHPWADVRILGCQYVQKHRLPQLAPLLIPLLQERNQAVQVAAIRAAGFCRNPIVIDGLSTSETSSLPSGLRLLLGTVPGHIELEVLLALARLDDSQGKSELIKLAYSPDGERRREVVTRISELDDREFSEPLIRLGWTETDPQVQRVILEGLNRIIPEAEQPDLSKASNYDERMKVWSVWLEQSKSNK